MKMPQWYYSLRNAPLRGVALLIIGLVRLLPGRAAYAMGRALGAMVWVLHLRWRRNTRRNLQLFMGDEYREIDAARIGKAAAVNLAYHIIEFIRMGHLPVDEALDMVVETEGLEHYERALEAGKGIIGLAMHYGNWELSGAYINCRVRTLYAVGKEQRDPFFTKIAFPWRAKFGIKNIYAGKKANSAILRALGNNAVLGLLADQNGGKNGTFAPFAGHLASTVAGPAALALKTGAPLIVTFCRRIKPGQHRLIIKEPVDMSGLPADKQAATVEVLSRINAAYEAVIREDPNQWLWGHRRWKTRPPGEESLY
jgi:KDO2-lipid IV(A) lauroyltransferase